MGFFDRFKSQNKQQKEAFLKRVQDIQRTLFPGGEKEIHEDVNKFIHKLYLYYADGVIARTYIYALNLYLITENKTPERIFDAIKRDPENIVADDDIQIIVEHALAKLQKIYTIDSKVEDVEISNEELIFLICKSGIHELESKYKKLTKPGQYEVLLFNCAFFLLIYRVKNPNELEKVKLKLIEYLITRSIDYDLDLDFDQLTALIQFRLKYYTSQSKFIIQDDEFLPDQLCYLFYESPLDTNPFGETNTLELFMFNIAFREMINWVARGINDVY